MFKIKTCTEQCDRVEDFLCNDGTCISKSQVCDRIYNCPDKSDERNCRKLFLIMKKKILLNTSKKNS